MGKTVSDKQLQIIQNNTTKLYLGLDPDASVEIEKICRKLNDWCDIYLLFPPSGRKDLGECSFEEVEQQFQKAPKYTGQVFLNLKGF